MARLLTILFIGLICEAIGVVLLSRGLKEIGWFFTRRDIKDLTVLISKLSSHQDPVSEFIWPRLSTQEQKEVLAPNVPQAEKERLLVRTLNRALSEAPLYDPARFANIDLSGETRERLARTAAGNHKIELNRFLLQDAYPRELAQQNAETVSVSQVLALVGRGFANLHVVLGVFFEALFFVGLLMLMSKADVSFVWPLTSLSFVVTTVAAKIYLHEDVSPLRWAGVCLIMLGAGLISWTEKQHTASSQNPEPSSAQRSAAAQ